MTRDETTWTWWTLPPAISGCFAQGYRRGRRPLLVRAAPVRTRIAVTGLRQARRISARGIQVPGARGPTSGRVQGQHSGAGTAVQVRLRIRPMGIAECDPLALASRSRSRLGTGTIPSIRSLGGAQNSIFCRAGYLWRMRGEVQQLGTVAPGHDRHESGLRDPRRTGLGVRCTVACLSRAPVLIHAVGRVSACKVGTGAGERPFEPSLQPFRIQRLLAISARPCPG